jgi:O-antigen ligase
VTGPVGPGAVEPRPAVAGRPSGWTDRATAVTVGCAALLVVALTFLGPVPGPVGLLLVGVAVALVAAVLCSPAVALVVLLLASFTRSAIKVPGLPAEPMILALGALLVSLVIAQRRGRLAVRFGWVELGMAAYLLWNLGSAVFPHALAAVEPMTGQVIEVSRFIVTGTALPFAAYLGARALFRAGASTRPLLVTVVVLAGYSALTAILQFTGPRSLVWPAYILSNAEWPDRAVGIFSQPVVNGMVLVAGFLVGMFLAQERALGRFPRLCCLAVALMCVPAIYLTRTRAVWLAFAVGVVLCLLYARGRRTGFAVVLAGAAVFIVATWSTFTSSDRDAGGVGSTNELNDRLNAIATSLWAIRREPVFGWGIGRFSALNTYYHQKWSPTTDFTRGYSIPSHENELGIAAELGLVGLALWLSVLVGLLVLLVRALRRLPVEGMEGRPVGLLAVTVMGTWVVCGFTADLRFFDFANLLVFVLVGAVVGLADRTPAAATAAEPGPLRVPEVVR